MIGLGSEIRSGIFLFNSLRERNTDILYQPRAGCMIQTETSTNLRSAMVFAFRLEKTAYRWTSITLAIIVLIPRSARAP
jgi:hypothetical protein